MLHRIIQNSNNDVSKYGESLGVKCHLALLYKKGHLIYLYLVSLSFSFSLVLLLSIYLNYRQSSLMLFHTKYNGCEHCRENGMFCGLYLFYIFDEISPNLLHPSVQNAKRGFYFSITLSVKLLLSVAYSPSVTWLFLFNSFVGQAYK